MKRVSMAVWMGYVWAVTMAGLAIHPYKSVKRMVLGERVLLPIALSPLLRLLILFVIGRVGSYAMNLGGAHREIMAAILGSTLIGLLLWQGLLLALVYRFWRAK